MYNLGMILLFSLLSIYAFFALSVAYLWSKLPKLASRTSPFTTRISVIVPVRNEATTIGTLIENLNDQRYTTKLFEVIIVDDASTDDTAKIAESYIHKSTFRLTVLRLTPDATIQSPKKRAIEAALQKATGELIITTDGDCRVGPEWLTSFAEMYQTRKAKLISGPVTFDKEYSLMDHLQTVEFSSLIGSGASSIQAGKPSLCNGANLAYSKAAFEEVGGYAGNEHIASGDDEFLLHKIATKYPADIYFLKDPRAIVRTTPHTSWRDFFRQRVRWASKWKYYKNPVSIGLAVFIFSCNAALLVALVLGLSGVLSWQQVGVLALLKWLPEWVLISSLLLFFEKSRSIVYIPLVQILYPFYVTLFGLAGQRSSYVWKGRSLR